MATNPFEDEDANYFVLINDEGQHSLWPVFADVPDGWEVIFGEDKRQACLDFIEKNWTDMRPNSLIRQMEADAAGGQNRNGVSGNGSSAKAARVHPGGVGIVDPVSGDDHSELHVRREPGLGQYLPGNTGARVGERVRHLPVLFNISSPFLSTPTIVAVGLGSAGAEWNDYVWPLVIINSPSKMTLPVGLELLQSIDVGR